jgi:hypothetical protein
VRTASADFRKRARHYRFAAALTNTPRDVATFDGLAAMFDQIACRFRHGAPARPPNELITIRS